MRGAPPRTAPPGRGRAGGGLAPRRGGLAGRGQGGGPGPGARPGARGRLDHHPAVGEEHLRHRRADPCGASWPRPPTPGGWSGPTPRRPSWRSTSTPSTSARAPTVCRRPPRPSRLGRPAHPAPGGAAGRDDPGPGGLRPLPPSPGRPGPPGHRPGPPGAPRPPAPGHVPVPPRRPQVAYAVAAEPDGHAGRLQPGHRQGRPVAPGATVASETRWSARPSTSR
jgi:translation initiation factor IF-2